MVAHKWWRLANLVGAKDSGGAWEIAELDFYTAEQVTVNPVNAFSQSAYNTSNYALSRAFDKNLNTWTGSQNSVGNAYYIGVQYDTPVTVTGVVLSIAPSGNIERTPITQADLQYSDDGTNWTLYKQVNFDFSNNAVTAKFIIDYYTVGGKSMQDNGIASRLIIINDWETGEFVGKATPNTDGSWQFFASNKNQLIITHVGDVGFRPISDAPVTPK